MKINFLLSIGLCLIFQLSYSQQEYFTSLKEMNVKGNVKKITEKSFYTKYKNGMYQKDHLYSTTVFIFNEKGNLLDETKNETDSRTKQKKTSKITYTYNDQGNLVEINTSKDGNSAGKISYVYNDKGIKTGFTEFFSNGNISSKQDFKINEKGQKSEVIWFGPGGNGSGSKLIYRYDDKGNPFECITYTTEGKIYSRKYFTYEESGKLAEMKNFMDQKQLEHITYKYDQAGNMIQLYQYAETGSVYSKNIYDHVYDHSSNWIKKTHYNNGRPLIISERDITYTK